MPTRIYLHVNPAARFESHILRSFMILRREWMTLPWNILSLSSRFFQFLPLLHLGILRLSFPFSPRMWSPSFIVEPTASLMHLFALITEEKTAITNSIVFPFTFFHRGKSIFCSFSIDKGKYMDISKEFMQRGTSAILAGWINFSPVVCTRG